MKKLSESVWGDLHSRGIGELEREEDEINHLDMEGLYDYLQEKYKGKIFTIRLFDSSGVDKDITIEPIEYVSLTTQSGEFKGHPGLNYILVNSVRQRKFSSDIMSQLTNRFNIKKSYYGRLKITEKDDTCTNQTFVDLIDIFVNNKENILTESVWADLHSRGVGETEREEDNINNFGMEELYQYILTQYKQVNKKSRPLKTSAENRAFLTIPVFIPENYMGVIRLNADFIDDMIDSLRLGASIYECSEFSDELKKRFNIEHTQTNYSLILTPKEGKLSNQTFIDLMDLIIEKVKKPIWKKREV